MKINIYAIFDEKAQAFGRPYFCNHNGEAIRAFQDAVCEQGSRLAKHPADYKLYCLGNYDDNSGAIKGIAEPLFLANATDYLKTEDALKNAVA